MSSTQKKILLAEDDPSMRNFLALLLKKSGYEVSQAEDGLAAFEAAMAGDFDVVVADDIMPNMTGNDLCRMLRADEKFKEIPIVILSGREDAATEDSENGANAYLLKTVNLKNELVDVLSELLQPVSASA